MQRPLYQVVIDTIVARIATGELSPGAMLPSETQLGAELGVSQGTARKALMELEARKLVQRVQGKGTFVTVQTPENALFHFFRLRNADGSRARPELVSETVRRRAATADEAASLKGAPAEVIEIARVRSLHGRAVAHETSVVPCRLFPGLEERAPLPNTLYVLFQQAYGCIIIRADEALSATVAEAPVAQALGVGRGTPVLRVDRRASDLLDRIVELRRSYYLTQDLIYKVALS